MAREIRKYFQVNEMHVLKVGVGTKNPQKTKNRGEHSPPDKRHL